jgi:hypothetical protein
MKFNNERLEYEIKENALTSPGKKMLNLFHISNVDIKII